MRSALFCILWLLLPSASLAEFQVRPLPNLYEDVSLISSDAIKEDMIRMLEKKGLTDYRLTVELQGYGDTIRLAHYDTGYRVTRQDFRLIPQSQRFEVGYRFTPLTAGIKSQDIRIKGYYDMFMAVPVAATPQPRGSILREEDITTIEISTRDIKNGVITKAEDLIGKEVKVAIPASKVIRMTQLVSPRVVMRNNVVDIVYHSGTVALKTIGTALSDGSIGEMIDVRNNSSSKVIQAVVTAPNLVQVQALPMQHYALNGLRQ